MMGRIRNSLAFKISIAYAVLALINLIFFSVMIIENQTDLIASNFKYQADNLAQAALGSLRSIDIQKDAKRDYRQLRRNLQGYELNWFKVYDAQAKLQYAPAQGRSSKAKTQKRDAKEIRQKIAQVHSSASLFQARYLIELQKEDFSIELLLPLKASGQDFFLFASLNLRGMQERLLLVYYQVAGAIIWGIIFHVFFAVYLARLILRRVLLLVDATMDMKKGNLSARIQWERPKKKQDELDILGNSFNEMAQSVQSHVDTITTLNKQIHQELKIGKEVQQILITAPEKLIEKCKPQVYYRPLREVSGDMFHYFMLPDGSMGIFFADASGHGVPAALVTAISFLTLEDVLRRGVPREEMMNALNESIAQRMQQNFYLTAVFLFFDTQGNLWAVNAGHHIFFIIPQKAPLIAVESEGLPVGILPESTYSLKKYKVRKGDKIFLYTDGLVETTNQEGQEFGVERIKRVIGAHHGSTKELSEALQHEFDAFARNFTDDVTFLSLEVP